MKVLMINKFLYPNGGSETYIFKLGKQLQTMGHQVQFFGMEHEGRIVGNAVNAYTSDMDFHRGSKLTKLTYPIKTIYSKEARVQIRKVLDDFKPDVCHLNNFNYQLTPSIILEIKKWSKKCQVVYTAHDGQLVCPNHLFKNPNTNQICEKCIDGHFMNCMKGKCIHGSTAKSVIGTMEATFWKWKEVYQLVDTVICPSEFMKTKLEHHPAIKGRTITLHNFVDQVSWKEIGKKDYVLYFGRYSEEKGIGTLIAAAKELPDIQFVFAGTGPMVEQLKGIRNIKEVGFKTGNDLEKLIREARFSIYPSEWYENCPFSVMESQMYGTPVLGANIGGIPELIRVGKTGDLFESANKDDMKRKIELLWQDKNKAKEYSENCRAINFDKIEEYCEKLMKIYEGRFISCISNQSVVNSL
jgi:glycosyltransferase involved in cell wall biosynthesis